MAMRWLALLLVLCSALVTGADTTSYLRLRGLVKDQESGDGLTGVAVVVFRQAQELTRSYTKADGKYLLHIARAVVTGVPVSLRFSGKSSYTPRHLDNIEITADLDLPTMLMAPYHEAMSAQFREGAMLELIAAREAGRLVTSDLAYLGDVEKLHRAYMDLPTLPSLKAEVAEVRGKLTKLRRDQKDIWAGVDTNVDGLLLSSQLHGTRDWLTAKGSYTGWNFSSLTQISPKNVNTLSVAWRHDPGPIPGGVQTLPLIRKGVLYYTTADNRVWALSGKDGAVLWSTQIAFERIAITNPQARGVALGYGLVITVSLDGRLYALDMLSGQPVWDTPVLSEEPENLGFVGVPLVIGDKVIVGTSFSGSGAAGAISALNVKTGKPEWKTYMLPDAEVADWPPPVFADATKGAWLTGAFDPETELIYWGVDSVSSLEGSGVQWSSVMVLDARTGKIRSYLRESDQDFSGASGATTEILILDRAQRRFLIHPNKGGFVYVYSTDGSRRGVELAHTWRLSKTANFATRIDANSGQLIGLEKYAAGTISQICPGPIGAISPGSGSYNPITGLYYRTVQEWCASVFFGDSGSSSRLTWAKFYGGLWEPLRAPGNISAGRVSARDPISGMPRWEVAYDHPPLGGLLSTASGLVFVPRADGVLEALDASSGRLLWSYRDSTGYAGGVVSYEIDGTQYLAVTKGLSQDTTRIFSALFGQPFKTMATDSGGLTVFALR